MSRAALPLGAALLTLAVPATARAFCGFYVAPTDAPLVNDATMVALMREGTRTVLSMSNTYKGPLADFAMVVPVPVVLQKENVKTLPLDLFAKLERLSAAATAMPANGPEIDERHRRRRACHCELATRGDTPAGALPFVAALVLAFARRPLSRRR